MFGRDLFQGTLLDGGGVSSSLFGAELWLVCVFQGTPVQEDVGWAPTMGEKWQLGVILMLLRCG